MKVLLVVCNMPDATLARQLAETLVAEQLAACVNILPSCQSVYRWQGQLESTTEVPLLIRPLTQYMQPWNGESKSCTHTSYRKFWPCRLLRDWRHTSSGCRNLYSSLALESGDSANVPVARVFVIFY